MPALIASALGGVAATLGAVLHFRPKPAESGGISGFQAGLLAIMGLAVLLAFRR